jgi:hypothetical protein
MHAKKTRLRKKQQVDAMANRIKGLESEAASLRQAVDDRRTAYILLGISGVGGSCSGGGCDDPFSNHALEAGMLAGSAPGAGGCVREGRVESSSSPQSRFESEPDGHDADELGGDEDDEGGDDLGELGGEGGEDADGKRTRRRGKFSAAERELIRRERNRMHAKKTRDRKRVFLEEAEVAIGRLERSAGHLRRVMAAHGMGDVARAVPRAAPLVTPTDEELTRALLADESANGASNGASNGHSGGDGGCSMVDTMDETDSPRRLGSFEDEN